jgi:hypothetical protein
VFPFRVSSPGPSELARRLPALPTVTAHLGRSTVSLRPVRTQPRFGLGPRSRFVGSVGLGLLSVSWLRRSPGRTHWGLEGPRTPRTASR